MESRMQGNLHVRFGAGDEETCPGDGARRFIPTLPKSLAVLLLSSSPNTREKHNLTRRRYLAPPLEVVRNIELRGLGLGRNRIDENVKGDFSLGMIPPLSGQTL